MPFNPEKMSAQMPVPPVERSPEEKEEEGIGEKKSVESEKKELITFEELREKYQKEPPHSPRGQEMVLDYPDDNLPQMRPGDRIFGILPLKYVEKSFASLSDRNYIERILDNAEARNAWIEIAHYSPFKDLTERALKQLESRWPKDRPEELEQLKRSVRARKFEDETQK